MTKTSIEITPEVRAILEESAITERTLTLPDRQLPRPLYVAVNKVLEAAGGKWDRKARAHVFDRDPREQLGEAIITRHVVDRKKLRQAYYTPDEIADQLIEYAEIEPGQLILEPSAGDGQLVKAALRACDRDLRFVCFELDPDEAEKLRPILSPDDQVEVGDFLSYPSPEDVGVGTDAAGVYFDRVIMNPPFTRGQDMQHVEHALGFLKPGGVLAAVVGAMAGKGETKAHQHFREVLNHAGEWDAYSLPEGSFKESGTGVNAKILCVWKH